MALTTQINESTLDRDFLDQLRRLGCNHLTHLQRVYNVQEARLIWAWKTKAGNVGFYPTERALPTTEEMTAMFAAIKLTD